MSGVMCVLAGMTSAAGEVQTVTCGIDIGKVGDTYGFSDALAIGSVSDGTFNLLGGAAILSLYWFTDGVNNILGFTVDGALANSGWTQLVVGGNTYTRASASYSGSGPTSWTWTTATNPFPVAATNYSVTFT